MTDRTTPHPWLTPSASLVARVARARATAALRDVSGLDGRRLGARAPAWSALLAALPALLRADAARVFGAVARVDVLAALFELARGSADAERLERALLTLWLALAGHPGLAAPLVLPGPFRVRAVDPAAPRLLDLGEVRALAATSHGAAVFDRDGRRPLDAFVSGTLPCVGDTVIVTAPLEVPDAESAARVRAALTVVTGGLPGGRLERVTIGGGDAAYGEARVSPAADPGDLAASAEASFVRAASVVEPLMERGGALVVGGRRLSADEALARACGDAVALPWRAERVASRRELAADLDEIAVLAAPTRAGAGLLAALRDLAGGEPAGRRRALLVNVDADDFVYSFQFGRSVERRCVERGLDVDRIAVDPGRCGDLPAELGGAVPAPVADGCELLIGAEDDPALAEILRRLASRRYEVVIANVRPRVFHDLLAGGFLAARTLLWDRHLHGGLRAEGDHRGVAPRRIGELPLRCWSLANRAGEFRQPDLLAAGLTQGTGHLWTIDLAFFRSAVTRRPGLIFAGGDNGRDWPLFIEAVRGLALEVHLVTREPPADLPPNVLADRRLTLSGFRDAMAAAEIAAVPLLPKVAAGVTILPMAMALGTAVVATRSSWTDAYVRDGVEALLVPEGDAGAFREATVRLHEDGALRAELVANARRRVAELFDLEGFTRAMFATLD